MLSFIRAIKFAAIIGVAAATLAAGSTASRAESGAVRLHIVKAGLIVGVGGGSGTLVFKGRSYRLSRSVWREKICGKRQPRAGVHPLEERPDCQ